MGRVAAAARGCNIFFSFSSLYLAAFFSERARGARRNARELGEIAQYRQQESPRRLRRGVFCRRMVEAFFCNLRREQREREVEETEGESSFGTEWNFANSGRNLELGVLR